MKAISTGRGILYVFLAVAFFFALATVGDHFQFQSYITRTTRVDGTYVGFLPVLSHPQVEPMNHCYHKVRVCRSEYPEWDPGASCADTAEVTIDDTTMNQLEQGYITNIPVWGTVITYPGDILVRYYVTAPHALAEQVSSCSQVGSTVKALARELSHPPLASWF